MTSPPRSTPRDRELARVNFLIHEIANDGKKITKYKWVRAGAGAFLLAFLSTIVGTSLPISRELIISAIIAGATATKNAVWPTVPLDAIWQHLEDAHYAAKHDQWVPPVPDPIEPADQAPAVPSPTPPST